MPSDFIDCIFVADGLEKLKTLAESKGCRQDLLEPYFGFQDEMGYSAIYHAAFHNKTAELRYMIVELGADIAHIRQADNGGKPPLHVAASRGNLGCCKLLVEEGRASADIAEKDESGQTPLDWAELKQHTDIVQYLLSKKK